MDEKDGKKKKKKKRKTCIKWGLERDGWELKCRCRVLRVYVCLVIFMCDELEVRHNMFNWFMHLDDRLSLYNIKHIR